MEQSSDILQYGDRIIIKLPSSNRKAINLGKGEWVHDFEGASRLMLTTFG
jgi:hypothetical protein